MINSLTKFIQSYFYTPKLIILMAYLIKWKINQQSACPVSPSTLGSCQSQTALIMLATLSSTTCKISSPQRRGSSTPKILCGHQQHLTQKMELNPLDLFPPFLENNSQTQDSLLFLALSKLKTRLRKTPPANGNT